MWELLCPSACSPFISAFFIAEGNVCPLCVSPKQPHIQLGPSQHPVLDLALQCLVCHGCQGG